MKLKNLLDKYPPKTLTSNNGDPAFRRSVWGPFFENLYEDKLIYRERFICLAKIENLNLTDQGVTGSVVPLHFIRIPRGLPAPRFNRWGFGGTWAHMFQVNGYLTQPYAGWSVWPEADRVRAIEGLLAHNDTEGALELLE
ncbi:MAG: hypothetical protein WCK17_09340 [Verrucomicrobiota bacterium]|jgi:hypothetical protein